MRKLDLKNDKRGFSTVMTIIGSVIGVILLFVFGFVFVQELSDASLLDTGTAQANAVDNLEANFTEGANDVAEKIPTAFKIGVFILVVVLLLLAWNFARSNGLIPSGSQQLG